MVTPGTSHELMPGFRPPKGGNPAFIAEVFIQRPVKSKKRGPSMHEMEGPRPDLTCADLPITRQIPLSWAGSSGPEIHSKHQFPSFSRVTRVSPGAIPVSGDKRISTASGKPPQEVPARNLENFYYPHVHPHDGRRYPPRGGFIHRVIHSCVHSDGPTAPTSAIVPT
jgi:hypothetical protein